MREVGKKQGFLSRRTRLIVKFTLPVTILVGVILVGISATFIHNESADYQRRTREESISLAQTVAAALSNALVLKDYAFILDHSMLVLKTREAIRYIIVIRKDKKSLIHTRAGWEQKALTDATSRKMEAIEEPVFFRYHSPIARQDVFEAAVPITVSNFKCGVIRVGFSSKSFDEHMSKVYLRTIILAMICLIFAVFGAVFMAMRIASPIEKAEKLAQAYEQLRTAHQKQKETQDELSLAYRRLAEHDKLKSTFFDNVSHELRTPLTLILTPLERLLAGEHGRLGEEVEGKLRSMQGNTQRLLRLVNQLLEFSAIESGGTTLGFEKRNIRELAEPIVDGFVPFARSKELQLELRGADDLPEIYVDPEKLDKIICNLLSNACKFTPPGGSVVVRLGADETSVIVTVKDTGQGIPEKDLPSIFERFRRLDSEGAARHAGTGIGLALAKELVDLIGGRIQVESEIGFGTTFTVALPLGTDHIPDSAMIRSASSEVRQDADIKSAAMTLEAEVGIAACAEISPEEAQQRADRIAGEDEDTRPLLLIVEDNPDMRALVADICQEEFRVIEAADGQQGLDMIHRHMPALVITDVMMPGMDGHQLLKRVRRDPVTASIPVMMLTAKASYEKRIEGLESGADDYLSKPFESRELLARSRNLVRLQQQEAALRQLNATLQQQVVSQTDALERARMLGRFLPREVARSFLEGEQPVQIGQQRRRLTVFTIELRGFDMVIEAVDPEDMAAMLNGYLSAMMDLAFSHGATVDRFARDHIVGFFGAPITEGAQEDAVRCSRMAARMWERAVEVCEQWRELIDKSPPVPTIALASGYATVGNFGSSNRMEYTAVGGSVDEAVALLPSVNSGEVVCSQSTWMLVQGKVEGQFRGEATIRHRSRKVKLYRIGGSTEMGTTDLALQRTARAVTPVQGLPTDTIPTPTPSGEVIGAVEEDTGRLKTGTMVSRRYKVLRRLGEGGMGTIYLAHDVKLSTDVALKLLRYDRGVDPKRLLRLYREVKLARLVSHTNVARIYDLGEWDSHEFISMEYIQGQTLDYRLKTSGAFSLQAGQNVLLQLCDGLAAAHAVGVVHRDLKPANVMLEQGGRVVILDFGIARWVSSLHQTGTETHGAIGTPHYMAPEQFDQGNVDHRADIYALGVVAYELFTGAKPFDADSAVGIAYKHTHEAPPDPIVVKPDLPPRLAAVILRCLAKSPDERFSNVTDISALIAGGVPVGEA